MVNTKDKEKKLGLMEINIQVDGKTVYSMALEKPTVQRQEKKLQSNGEKEKNGTLQQFKKRKLIPFFIINHKKSLEKRIGLNDFKN
jgi:hypothetical protein